MFQSMFFTTADIPQVPGVAPLRLNAIELVVGISLETMGTAGNHLTLHESDSELQT